MSVDGVQWREISLRLVSLYITFKILRISETKRVSWKKISPRIKFSNISKVQAQSNAEKLLKRTQKECVRCERSSRLACLDGTAAESLGRQLCAAQVANRHRLLFPLPSFHMSVCSWQAAVFLCVPLRMLSRFFKKILLIFLPNY